MFKTRLSVLCYTALSVAVLNNGYLAAADEWDSHVDEIMANFTTLDIVGQMTKIAIYGLTNATYQLDEDALRTYAKLHVGSYIGLPMSVLGEINGSWGWTTAEMRAFVHRIQEIAMEENGSHPMIYGVDAAHGNALVTDAVYFGQQINVAATFNPDLAYEQGRITARDTLATGVPLVFDPVLDIMHNPLPRVYETFEFQQVCRMHEALDRLLLDTDTEGVTISDFDLLNTYFPPYNAPVDAGLLTGMESYISVNGVPVIENTKLMTTLLRDDLGFDDLMVSDFGEINHLVSFHRTARSTDEATKFSLERTSVDMSTVGSSLSFTNGTNKSIEEKPELIGRLNESVSRIIKTKL